MPKEAKGAAGMSGQRGYIVQAVKDGFDLSEASSTPVMLQLRIRACHVHGRFTAENVDRVREREEAAVRDEVAVRDDRPDGGVGQRARRLDE